MYNLKKFTKYNFQPLFLLLPSDLYENLILWANTLKI